MQCSISIQAREKKPWGTTDALCSAKEFIKEPFIVCNSDDLYGREAFELLSQKLIETKECCSIGFTLKNVLPESCEVNRGIFEVDDMNYILNIKEVFNISRHNLKEKGLSEDSLTSMNLFGLLPEILKKLQRLVIEFKKRNINNPDAEALLSRDLSLLIQRGLKVKVYPSESRLIGITHPEDEKRVKELIKKDPSII